MSARDGIRARRRWSDRPSDTYSGGRLLVIVVIELREASV